MINNIKLIIVNSMLIGFAFGWHTLSCDDAKLYKLSFEKTISKIKQPVTIKFEYTIGTSLKESLLRSNLFNEREKEILKKELVKKEFNICSEVIKRAENLENNSQTYNNKGTAYSANIYQKINFSKPIFISDDKAYLFFKNVLIRNNGNTAGGSTVMQTFEKQNDSWNLTNTKIIEYY